MTTLTLLMHAPTARAQDTNDGDSADTNQVIMQPALVGQPTIATTQHVHGFVGDIEKLSSANHDFRQVLYTAKHMQVVLMALKPGEDIGSEVHANVDQFIRVEQGNGEAVLNNVRTPIQAGYAVLIPAGTKHNIVNTSATPMKLYTLYAPPQHRDGVIHRTRTEAEQDHEHFDGKTTE